MAVHELSRADARRIAIRAQLLDRPRPTDLIDVVRRLTAVQYDQTAAVAPNADLVLWSRLGSAAYRASDLERALADWALIELRGMIRPAEDVALYRAEMAAWSGREYLGGASRRNRDWVAVNDGCRRDILFRLATLGPLTSRDIPDTCVESWQSTGWSNDRNVIQMLDFMVVRGEIAVVGRRGRDRVFDLAERVYPDDPAVPVEEAAAIRNERRLRSLGLARDRVARVPGEPYDVGPTGEPAVVEGIRGEWRVDPAQLGQPFSGRAALLSPLDRLVFDRKRTDEIFDFDYQLEMYKPAGTRRWGYFALPILYGDALVGKLDATSDRKAGVLRVNAIHRDVTFTKAMAAAVDREIRDLARFLELDLEPPA